MTQYQGTDPRAVSATSPPPVIDTGMVAAHLDDVDHIEATTVVIPEAQVTY